MKVPDFAFVHPITIAQEDFDDLDHVNNVVYVRWVQEVAGAHWRSVAPPDMLASSVWVVSRHEIDYLRPVLASHKIEGRTWVLPPEGPRSYRCVAICRSDTGEVMAFTKTTWYLLDSQSMRPKRIEPHIIECLQPWTLTAH
jgi:acyl-CoA thioester hydrolase